ncbi:MAG TPA: hypothetical protein VIV60_25825 [Polyangiaceae bacterium]
MLKGVERACVRVARKEVSVSLIDDIPLELRRAAFKNIGNINDSSSRESYVKEGEVTLARRQQWKIVKRIPYDGANRSRSDTPRHPLRHEPIRAHP